MCAIVTPEAQEGPRRMQPAKWVQDGDEVKAASPAKECVRLLRLDERQHEARPPARHDAGQLHVSPPE